MKKLLMIINTHSGLSNSKNRILDALDVFSAHGYNITTYVPQAVNDAYQYLVKNKVEYDVVCAFGGDGTLNEVTNGLMTKKNRPMIGYFPSGTMNDFGSNFYDEIDFRKIAEGICKDEYREFDVGKFNDKYFNYVAAFGAMCDVPYTTSRKAKSTFGTLAYLFEGLSKIDEVKPINAKVTFNGKTKQMKLLFGLIYSGGRVAGQQIVSKNKSKLDDGEFNILLVDYVDNGIINFPDLLATLAMYKKHVHMYKASEITIESTDKVAWTIDGEEAKVDKIVNIKNINKAMKIKA